MTGILLPWVCEPFYRVVEHLRETGRFGDAVVLGIESIGKIVLAEQLFQELEETLENDSPKPEKEKIARLKYLREKEAEAKNQLEQGLPSIPHQFLLCICVIDSRSILHFQHPSLCS